MKKEEDTIKKMNRNLLQFQIGIQKFKVPYAHLGTVCFIIITKHFCIFTNISTNSVNEYQHKLKSLMVRLEICFRKRTHLFT